MIIIIIIITLPIPGKAFGHNQLPIPNKKLENKIKKTEISIKPNLKYFPRVNF